MTPEQLKASILQYAIQGKLVEQRPEEGTAENLYQQIQEEKQKLIKEGKIKKEKPLPEITADEIPFDIPDSWMWVRLSTVGITQTGNTPKKSHPEYFGNHIPFLGPGDIQNGNVNYNNQGLSEEGKDYGRVTPANSILQVCIGGSIGKCSLVDRDVAFNQQINSVFPILSYSSYIYYTLNSNYFKEYMKENAGGTATPIINRGLWDTIIIPLSPLKEQHRIVAKIEELLPYVDRYAEAYEKLEQFNAKFPEDMKKSILQYAIQGKLVEQRPEEGTTEELYQQIQDEKQKLIKEGKIKKEKPLAEITEDEIPFDIPESWKWIKFGEIYTLTNGLASRGTPGKPMCPVLRLADLSNDSVDISDVRALGIDDKEKLSHLVKKGDLIFIRVNGTRERVGRAYLYDGDKEISYCDHLFCGHALTSSIDVKYIQYIFNSHFNRCQLKPEIKTTAGQNTISQQSMKNIILPLPPYKEQLRIVAKIEELLPYCDRLVK